MRKILLSLVLINITSGFVIAESTSSIRTDFYVSALSTDSSEQQFPNSTNNKSLIISCIATLITLAIIILILQKILKKKKRAKTKKFKKIKKARRKK